MTTTGVDNLKQTRENILRNIESFQKAADENLKEVAKWKAALGHIDEAIAVMTNQKPVGPTVTTPHSARRERTDWPALLSVIMASRKADGKIQGPTKSELITILCEKTGFSRIYVGTQVNQMIRLGKIVYHINYCYLPSDAPAVASK